MDRKRIQCLSNASQHVPIYLQLRYSELLVGNCDIFRPHLCLAAPQGVALILLETSALYKLFTYLLTPLEFRETRKLE